MNTDELRFFNPWVDIDKTENRLPHWQQTGRVYFVTWRLADALPQVQLEHHYTERKSWLRAHPRPWSSRVEKKYHEKFSTRIDRWLDAGHGSCILRNSACASVVADALTFFEGKRTCMISYVVMPNHLHALFVLNSDWKLNEVIHSWKRHSSREINRLQETHGRLWQKDYFDRLVRDSEHFANCVRYIRSNPVKACLKERDYLLFESEPAQQV